MNRGQITLKEEVLDVNHPAYYVTVNEGAFFDLCKAQKDNLRYVLTNGLCGCVAIAIYIKDGTKSYLFLNHIPADLPISEVDSEIEKIKNSIGESLPGFDYADDILESSVFVVANQFRKPGTPQERRTGGDIAREIFSKLSTRMEGIDRPCHYVYAKTVGFSIKNNQVKLFEPNWTRTFGRLTYYGERHGGYGSPSDPNMEPYKDTCEVYDFEYRENQLI
jgi:hypothetical protein